MKNTRRNVRGFTLVEVSLALLVSVVILSGVGYLYLNASTVAQGNQAGNEALSAATLGLSLMSGGSANTVAIESGAPYVSAIAESAAVVSGGVQTVSAYVGITLSGTGADNNGWGAKIPQNVCTVIWNEITSAGFLYNINPPTTLLTTSTSLLLACPSGGAATQTIYVSQAPVV